MANAAEQTRMTIREYLAFERESPEKHAYVRGEIFAMSGASPRHNALVVNLLVSLHQALRGSKCRPFPSDMRTWVPALETFTYPDVSVICGELEFYEGTNDTITNPRVIIEVLSDSTERYDRGEKAEGYRQMPSVTDHLLVSQHKLHVEHYARQADGSWLLREYGSGAVAIASIGATLAIDDVYRDLPALPG